jgi:glycosyltransferase involved in cell wall biosynthesis
MAAPSTDAPDLMLALPCYNEADGLRTTVTHLTRAFRERQVEVVLVLVDNGSTDGTGAVIDALIADGLPVIKETVSVNQGYGHGVRRGLRRCQGRLVGFVCADGQVEPEDVVRIYELAARSTPAALVKVRRRFRKDGAARKIVSIVYNAVTSVMFPGLGSIDINGNPKILPREHVEAMRLESSDWFLDAEVMIKAKRLGLPVIEVDVPARMREGGASNVGPGTCWEFVVNLFKYRFTSAGRRPLARPAAADHPVARGPRG